MTPSPGGACWACGEIMLPLTDDGRYCCMLCDVRWIDPDAPGAAEAYAQNVRIREEARDFETRRFGAAPAEPGADITSHP